MVAPRRTKWACATTWSLVKRRRWVLAAGPNTWSRRSCVNSPDFPWIVSFATSKFVYDQNHQSPEHMVARVGAPQSSSPTSSSSRVTAHSLE